MLGPREYGQNTNQYRSFLFDRSLTVFGRIRCITDTMVLLESGKHGGAVGQND